MIKRDQIKPPSQRGRKVKLVNAGPLQGEVALVGMMLSHRIAMIAATRRQKTVDFSYVAKVLADCVLADDNAPVYNLEQWEAFGVEHIDTALDLFNEIQDLSGLDKEASKKS